jgi:hypothetical protein
MVMPSLCGNAHGFDEVHVRLSGRRRKIQRGAERRGENTVIPCPLFYDEITDVLDVRVRDRDGRWCSTNHGGLMW